MFVSMLLADARLPSGGHAYSAGVEPALRGGLDPGSVRDYLLVRAETTARVEAATAVVARHRIRSGGDLAAVAAAWAARTPAPALRAASIAQGRGYRRLAAAVWPTAPELDALEAVADRQYRPLVLGAIAAATGLGARDLAALVIYDDAATAAASYLKLQPMDPAQTTSWVLAACAVAQPWLGELAELTDPDAIPATGAPQTEEWAQAHSLLTQRLFRA